ncbi:MAG: c-type cytochrome, partial [Flavobacteriales bacterium]
LIGLTAFAMACGGGESTSSTTTTAPTPAAVETPATAAPSKAVAGLITADDIKLGPIDKGMAAKGKDIYDVKCQACHSLGTNRVVGPGWEGVVEQRKPEWIMNMILHTDAMLESDEHAQALLEECLVRMPNQNLDKDDARNVLEFMRTLKPAKAS